MASTGLYSQHRNNRGLLHLRNTLIALVLVIFAALALFPIFYMITSSFGPAVSTAGNMRTIFPKRWTLDSYVAFFDFSPYSLRWIGNSFITSVSTVLGNVIFASMAGYAFAKLKFKGKNILFGIVLIQMMLPSQIFIIPQYQMVAKLSAADTVFALVFPGLVSAFGTFFLRQAYMGIPNEIGEAAYLDGCNQWQAFTKVMFPLTSSSVAALSVFTAVFAYGDLMWPLVVNSDLKMMTLSSGLATLRGQFSTNFPVLMAGSLLAMLPMVILYLFFQRQFIEGVAMTGGK